MDADAAVAWRDGELITAGEATLPVLSHAVQRGTTVFDVLKTVSTDDGLAAFGLRQHVARFFRSMKLMGMTTDRSVDELEAAVCTVANAFGQPAVVKLVAAWAEVAVTAMPVSTEPSIWVTAMPVSARGSAPLALKTATAPKLTAEMLPPSLKVAASYTIGVREKMSAIADGFDDVIFKTVGGDLAEGTTQSLFLVIDGRVVVPPLDAVLDGITRRMVLAVAESIGVTADVRPVAWSEVLDADELFLCSTTRPVMPIDRHDDRTLETPGPVSSALAAAADEVLAGRHELATRWLTPLS